MADLAPDNDIKKNVVSVRKNQKPITKLRLVGTEALDDGQGQIAGHLGPTGRRYFLEEAPKARWTQIAEMLRRTALEVDSVGHIDKARILRAFASVRSRIDAELALACCEKLLDSTAETTRGALSVAIHRIRAELERSTRRELKIADQSQGRASAQSIGFVEQDRHGGWWGFFPSEIDQPHIGPIGDLRKLAVTMTATIAALRLRPGPGGVA